MPSNKDRLYVALHARGGQVKMPGGEDRYHWALMLGPKKEDPTSRGRRLHAKEKLGTEWTLENAEIRMMPTAMILTRVLFGKVKDRDHLISVLEGVPLRPETPGWNCVGWVKEAVETLAKDGRALGSAVTDGEIVRDTALRYVREKVAAHRFDGKAEKGRYDGLPVPTYDLLEQRQTQE